MRIKKITHQTSLKYPHQNSNHSLQTEIFNVPRCALGHMSTPMRNNIEPTRKIMVIINVYPSMPLMVKGSSGGGGGFGAGQLNSQSTQLQAGVLLCNQYKIIDFKPEILCKKSLKRYDKN